MFCTKGDCPYLLQTVHKCFACGELSFDVAQNACGNLECEYFNVEMTGCEKCNKHTFVVEKGHSEFQRCINKDCELNKPGTAQKPVGEMKARQLEGMLRDTLALPMDMIDSAREKAAGPPESEQPQEPTPVPEGEPAPPVEMKTEPLDESAPAPPPPEPTLEVPEEVSAEVEPEPIPEPEPEPKPEPAVQDKIEELTFEEPELEKFEKPQRVVSTPSAPKPPAEDDLDLLGEPGLASELKDDGTGMGEFEAEASARESAPEPYRKPSVFFSDEPARRERAEMGFAQKGAIPSISEVFDFVSEYILKDEEGQRYPLYLVIGLSGSGKTTYLTMLGDILANKSMKYYFPYEGVDVKRTVIEHIFEKTAGATMGASPKLLDALKLRVKDLVYDFAQKHYANYIGKMQWSPATARERKDIESASEVSTYFLVTELRRYNRTIAKIVTIETSGEDYEEIIKGITQYKQAQKSGSPLQKVLIEMMDHAQGFVILVDPANEENDLLYQNLFLVLKESLEPRALNSLSACVRKKIEQYTQDLGSKLEEDDLRQAIAQMKKARELKERKQQQIARLKEKLTGRLSQASERFEEEGLDMLLGEEGDFIRKLEKIFATLSPEAAAAVQKRVEERKQDPKVLRSYYSGMIKQCLKNTDAIAEFQYNLRHKKTADMEKAGELITRAMKEVYQELEIPESFRLELDESLDSGRSVRKFQNIQYVAIAITKSDMYPIIYPPEKYPEKKLARCKRHLEAVENYLKLCGGEVRYYNTSATGYAVLKDTLFYPGKENTHSPINIVEPVFDMLHIT
jgi:energy-coupling factor transporter ATP-binding protein EcfA2